MTRKRVLIRPGTTSETVRTNIDVNITIDNENGRERGPTTGIDLRPSTEASRYIDARYTLTSEFTPTHTARRMPRMTWTPIA